MRQDQQEVTHSKELLTQAVTYPTVQNQGPQVVIEEGNQGLPPVIQLQAPIAAQIPPVVIQPILPLQVNLPVPQNNDQVVVGEQPQNLHLVNNPEPQLVQEDEMSRVRGNLREVSYDRLMKTTLKTTLT